MKSNILLKTSSLPGYTLVGLSVHLLYTYCTYFVQKMFSESTFNVQSIFGRHEADTVIKRVQETMVFSLVFFAVDSGRMGSYFTL